MKICLITDCHLGIRQSHDVWEEHILSTLDRVVQHCLDNGIDHIVCLGDSFDVRKNVNSKTLSAVKHRFFERLVKEQIKFIACVGNHDSYFKDTISVNSLSIHLSSYPNVTVYTEPSVHVFADGSNICLVPWISPPDVSDFMDKINEAHLVSDSCLGHFEFAGFVYQRGVVADHGMDHENISSLFRTVLSGHYHSKSTRGNVTYLGTAYDLTWADWGEDKFFHVFDTVTHELTPIKNEESLFHKLFYVESQLTEDLFKELGSTTALKDKVVKVIIQERKDSARFDLFMDLLYAQNPFSVDVVDETILDAADIKTEMKEMLSQSTIDIIHTVLEDVDVEGYDMGKVKSIMVELYNKVSL